MSQRYDLIIVGAGAGGGTLAYALAPTGKRILILERGGYLPREKANWDPNALFLEERYYVDEQWYDADHKAFDPETHYYVGGNTKVYGALLQRMRQEDFGEIHHHDGIAPAWGLDYEDFEPYYTQAEHLFKIHGDRSEDPTEPPASADYPYPPFPHEPRIQEVADGLKAEGLHPFHATLALDRNVHNPDHSRCIRCDTCDPYPCLVDAKCDAQVTCVDQAIQYPNVDLKTHTRVDRLVTDEAGQRIAAVEATQDGVSQRFEADIVILSCGAINSAKLLLRSATEQYPDGLANSSDLVGRNLMLHNHSAVTAVSRKPNNTRFQKTLAFHDYYFKGPNTDYPLGTVQLTGKAKWQRLKRFASPLVPNEILKYIAHHSVDFWVTTEEIPKLENRVRIGQNGETILDYTENNLKPHEQLIDVLKQHLKKQGFYWFWVNRMPLQVVWHQAGTCKFGTDPAASVLNLNCQTHDIDNLYVVDSSFIPTMGAVNLTLTIVANALRVADHLKRRLGVEAIALPEKDGYGARTLASEFGARR